MYKKNKLERNAARRGLLDALKKDSTREEQVIAIDKFKKSRKKSTAEDLSAPLPEYSGIFLTCKRNVASTYKKDLGCSTQAIRYDKNSKSSHSSSTAILSSTQALDLAERETLENELTANRTKDLVIATQRSRDWKNRSSEYDLSARRKPLSSQASTAEKDEVFRNHLRQLKNKPTDQLPPWLRIPYEAGEMTRQDVDKRLRQSEIQKLKKLRDRCHDKIKESSAQLQVCGKVVLTPNSKALEETSQALACFKDIAVQEGMERYRADRIITYNGVDWDKSVKLLERTEENNNRKKEAKRQYNKRRRARNTARRKDEKSGRLAITNGLADLREEVANHQLKDDDFKQVFSVTKISLTINNCNAN